MGAEYKRKYAHHPIATFSTTTDAKRPLHLHTQIAQTNFLCDLSLIDASDDPE